MCFYVSYLASDLKKLLLLGLTDVRFSIQAQQKVECY